MKKTFLVLGAAALTVSAAFAGNAFAKRAQSVAYYLDGSGICQELSIPANQFTQTGTATNTAQIRTNGGSQKPLFASRVNATQCSTTTIKFNP